MKSNRGKAVIAVLGLLAAAPASAAEYHVSPDGSDAADGSASAPLRTIPAALQRARAGDTINLFSGTYAGGLRINTPGITLRSAPGHWAVIRSPHEGAGAPQQTIRFDINSDGSVLERVEVVGGEFYAVKLESNWDWGPGFARNAAENITIRDSILRDSGRDVVKVTPGCDGVVIRDNEIHGSGLRDSSNAEGIDVVNADNVVIAGNHIHHTATTGAYIKGGSINGLIENNLVTDTGMSPLATPNSGAGLAVGYSTDAEWYDSAQNPEYHSAIGAIVRNNIIINTRDGGIVVVGALDPVILNNTLYNVAQAPFNYSAGIWIGELPTWIEGSTRLIRTRNPTVRNNIVVVAPDPDLRTDPLQVGNYAIGLRIQSSTGYQGFEGTLDIDHNLYHRLGEGTSPHLFANGWPASTLPQWQARFGIDLNSEVALPAMDEHLHLVEGSRAIAAGSPVGEGMIDYDGQPRRAEAPDIGADEYHADGESLPVPPAVGVIGTGLSGIASPPGGNTAPSFVDTPSISGTLRVGQILSVADTATEDADGDEVTLRYQWQRNGTDIAGATAVTYTVASADAGARLRVQVTASDGTDSTTVTTAAVTIGVTAPPPGNTPPAFMGTPAIGGEPQVGQTLSVVDTATEDADGDSVALRYQWQRNGTDIADATAVTYTVATADVGTVLRVRVIASDGIDSTAVTTSGVRIDRMALAPLVLRGGQGQTAQSFLRLVNTTGQSVTATLTATDDAGRPGRQTLRIALAPHEARQLNSHDLEHGAPAKGLQGQLGSGQGDWRLQLAGSPAEAVRLFAYNRNPQTGFVTSLHDTVPQESGRHEVVFFNPAGNREQASQLRLVNPGTAAATVTIRGTDDSGQPGLGTVSLSLKAGAAVMLGAGDLEQGATGLAGRLGDGVGKWRLRIESTRDIRVMSLVSNPAGDLTNVSSQP